MIIDYKICKKYRKVFVFRSMEIHFPTSRICGVFLVFSDVRCSILSRTTIVVVVSKLPERLSFLLHIR